MIYLKALKTKEFLSAYYKLTMLSLMMAAAFPEKKPLSTELRTFLLYKVWPIVFFTLWCPLVPMVVLKTLQYKQQREWDNLFEITYMFFVGVFSLYMIAVVQITSKHYKVAYELISKHFVSYDLLNLSDFKMIFAVWIGVSLSFMCYIGGCVFYKENLVPLWVPFTDNDKQISTKVFWFVWVYESFAAVIIFFAFVVWGPFIIVSCICIHKELSWLSTSFDSLNFRLKKDQRFQYVNDNFEEDFLCNKDYFYNTGSQFLAKAVDHHLKIKRVMKSISYVNGYVFSVQSVVAVIISCFGTFNIYNTTHLEKVLIKSGPIVLLIYYLMFAYCWNGQRLSDQCEALFRAVYRCPWYNQPKSFRKSLLLMMEVYKSPVQLTSAGVLPANFETFVSCVQQSVSYILLLKTLTTENK